MHRSKLDRGLGLAACLAMAVSAACAPIGSVLAGVTLSDEERLARSVMIVRDEWGVPHIHGETAASAAFGAAWAQAEDGYAAMEESYTRALGRAAWWYGEHYLDSDLAVAANEIERRAREEFDLEPADRQAIWSAYAHGLNYYRRVTGTEVRAITEWEPWMLFARMRYDDLIGDEDGDESFAAVVAPSRTVAGNALLLHARDHSFAEPGLSYEMHISSDDGWNVAGVAILGTPVPRAGHNGQIAWAHAGSAVAVTSENVDRARPGAGPDTPAQWQDTLRVNTQGGVVERVYSFRRTTGDSIIAVHDGTATIVRADAAGGGALQQWYALGRARDLTEFDAALATDALPVGATVAADTEGNILAVESAADGESARRVLNPPDGVLLVGAAGSGAVPHPVGRLVGADSMWTLETWAGIVFDTYAAEAGARIRGLALEWEQVGGTNAARAMQLDAALDRLRSWDGVATVDSRAAALYVLWQERVKSGLYDDGSGSFVAMEETLAQLEADWPDGVTWGELNRLQRPAPDIGFSDDHHSLPLAALPWWTGAGSNVIARTAPDTRRRYAERGYAWAGAVELGPAPVARSVSAYGQSAQHGSAHFFDQAELYAAGRMKDAWFDRDVVLANARRMYRPGGADLALPSSR